MTISFKVNPIGKPLDMVDTFNTANETDPLSLHLDQTTGQALTNVTDVTITASDEIYYGDVTDTNKIKKDTVQGILDLVPAPDLSAYAKLDGTNHPFTYVITPNIRPNADSATAVQITKADGTTSLFNVDTTNSGVYIRGTQNPANYLYAFAVNQTGGTGNTIFSRWSNDAIGASLVLGKSRSATLDTYSYLSSGDVIGRIAFSPAISSRFSSQGTSARIDASASEAHGATAKGTKLDFYTVPNTTLTTITALTISDAGNIKLPADNRNLYFGAADDASITFDGNSLNITANAVTATDDLILTARYVGIGTTAPAGKLHIVGDAFPVLNVERTTTAVAGYNSGIRFRTTSSGSALDGFGGSLVFEMNDAETSGSNLLGRVSAVRSGADNSGALVFVTANAGAEVEGMRILPNGYVGINTTTPNAYLQVKGGSADATGPGIMNFDTNTATNDTGVKFGAVAGATTSGYCFIQGKHTGVANDLNLALNPVGGNVGIGTTSPSARLHSLSTTEQLRLGYDASNYLSVTVGSGGDTTITSSGGDISFDNENIGTTGAVKGVHKAADGTAAVADGTYTMGLGGTTNGTITIKDGIITAVQQCVA